MKANLRPSGDQVGWTFRRGFVNRTSLARVAPAKQIPRPSTAYVRRGGSFSGVATELVAPTIERATTAATRLMNGTLPRNCEQTVWLGYMPMAWYPEST